MNRKTIEAEIDKKVNQHKGILTRKQRKQLKQIFTNLADAVETHAPEASLGDAVALGRDCGCVISTVKGMPWQLGFLQICDQHRAEIEKVDPTLLIELSAKIVDLQTGSVEPALANRDLQSMLKGKRPNESYIT